MKVWSGRGRVPGERGGVCCRQRQGGAGRWPAECKQVRENQAFEALRLPKRLRKRSTRPPASSTFCFPV